MQGRHPWWYIPSLYFAEGLPYILINTASVILYKRMGIDNTRIAFYTSWLYLPWVIKMFWGPLVEARSTKRDWILGTQLVLAAVFGATAFTLHLPGFFSMSLLFFFIGAFVSATHDIAADGFYMLALSEADQAFFVGIRSTFYRLAMIFGSGVLVVLAGKIETRTENIPLAWSTALVVAALLFAALAAYHKFMLPKPAGDGEPPAGAQTPGTFKEVFVSYFTQDHILPTLGFILFYRLGEAMLLKLVSPFLLDARAVGGLGLTTSQVGLLYGTIGVSALVVGGILGGWIISKYGFRKCIWPFIITMHAPDLFFLYMAHAQPAAGLAGFLVAAEQFGYGLGFTAFTVYLMMRASDSRYKTAHFAISTGIMALGMMGPGSAAGYIQQKVGYMNFFLTVCVCTLPSMLLIPFIPKDAPSRGS
jgi:PAT family beta-lactamase induction signal transducer AmpG